MWRDTRLSLLLLGMAVVPALLMTILPSGLGALAALLCLLLLWPARSRSHD